MNWTRYEDQKPAEGRHWFRVDPKYYADGWGGHLVEFVDVMRQRGAGLQTVLSPGFDKWDGYSVHIPTGIEWHPVTEEEILSYTNEALLDNKFFRVPGLDLKPCPFCGGQPSIEWSGRYITAPIWSRKHISIECCIPKIRFWEGDFNKLVDRWNSRKESPDEQR